MIRITILLVVVYFGFSFTINGNPCGQLYLTQSPHKKKIIQLNWNFTCNDPPDTILLTLGDIRINANSTILHRIYPGAILKGYHDTKFSLKNIEFPGNWTETYNEPDLNAKCFNYYIASVKNDKVIYSQCLSIQPAWMSNFGKLRIGNMMIPGTHNSGAYRGVPFLIRNYILNQDKNFWQQLVYGIRYFDIRIGRYGNSPQGFYLNHDFIKCTELVPELLSAADFLRKSPQEVIILDFHRFPYPKIFTITFHLELLEIIKDIFGELIYPFNQVSHPQGPKLEEFWSSGQRVIIGYREDTLLKEEKWLWPSVRRDWGNVQKVDHLKEYIEEIARKSSRGNPMKVLMAELTPDAYYVLKHVTRSLKDLAIMVNRELSDWIREQDRIDNFNIVATDFFTGNDVINIAIEENLKQLNSSPIY